jgi:hypothetical protein
MSILTDLNPTSLAVKALVVIAVVGGAYAFGHHEGYKGEKLVYDNYVLSQKSAAEAQVIANKTALDKQAAAFALQQKADHMEYTQNAQHIKAARDAANANAAQYAGRLQQYLTSSHGRPVLPDATGAAEGVATVGQSQTGLLDGVSSLNWYLTQRFSDADGIANTLNEAIDRIAQDQATCNGALPGVTAQ